MKQEREQIIGYPGTQFLIVEIEKLRKLSGDWKNYLLNAQGLPMENIEKHSKTGHPLGDNRFLNTVEGLTGRDLKKKKPGPKGDK